MSEFKIIEYTEKYFEKWNEFVENSNNGTIFHRLDFLQYHGGKFKKNEKHLIWLKGDTIYAVMPMAIFDDLKTKVVKSPYGASYGGIIYKTVPNYSVASQLCKTLIDYLRKNSITQIFITPPIGCYYSNFCETLNYTLLENNFKIVNSDITNIIRIDNRDIDIDTLTSRARNMINKARSHNIKIVENEQIDTFYSLLDKTYSKFDKQITHTLNDLLYLKTKFETRIQFNVAYFNSTPVSGIALFYLNKIAVLTFYLCQHEDYRYTQSQSFLIYDAIIKAQCKGIKIFDFGTSSEKMVARPNLFKFKESFGAIGVRRETYSLSLK